MNFFDFSTADKPEAYVSLASPITDGFRVDFSFRYVSAATVLADGATLQASVGEIRFRFGNTGVDPTSNSKTGLQLGFKYDGDFRYSRDNAGSLSTSSVAGTHAIGTDYMVSVVASNSMINTLNFTLGGTAYALAPLTYSILVDGALADQDILLQTGDTGYDPALGIGRFGFLGDSDANAGSSVYFDNLMLYRGSDISNCSRTLNLCNPAGRIGSGICFRKTSQIVRV